MACKRAKHGSCSVFGCTNEHRSISLVPSSEPMKKLWVHSIFSGNAPTQLPKVLYVCTKHFTDDCFLNLGQYRAGLAERLKIKSGSVPTLLGSATNLGQVSQLTLYNFVVTLHLEYIQSNKLSTNLTLLSLHRPAHQVLAFSCLSQGMLSARQTTWKHILLAHSYP